MDLSKGLKLADKEISRAVQGEQQRLNYGLELIPSENFVSKAVLEALGSVFTNKYSEGYPKKRYYGGNEFVDTVEDIAIMRTKKLFGAEHANVQPYSGSPANLAAYFALMKLGDKLMGMSLAHGGHLTHGHSVSFSGQAYKSIPYTVDKKTCLLDYEAIRKTALKEKPKVIVSGFTAYPRLIDFKRFHEIAEEVDAYSMADISHIAGLIVGGVHPSPFPFTDVITTTTHKTLRGPRGAIIMCKEKFAKAIDKAVFPGLQGGPHNHVTAAKAVALKEAMQPEFKDYARQIVKNAKVLADTLMSDGIGLVSGGTDNHLILIDLTSLKLTGKEAESLLGRANITCNKNMVPFDKRSPMDPSGIRIGTPALTTRGMKEGEMKEVASIISRLLKGKDKPDAVHKAKESVLELCRQFPLYGDEK